jgi:hypothetical protein
VTHYRDPSPATLDPQGRLIGGGGGEGEGEDVLHGAAVTPRGPAPVALKVDLAPEGLGHRPDDLPQRLEEPGAGAALAALLAGPMTVMTASARSLPNAAP